ncbi:hypothetical protein [Bacillus sp. ISL-7]|uniref:hypothetical protein n=1 Tax=Bacillus sp. ISL-7 TaxID=2819136 RepID=UPI001BE54F8A|nr:hypothetical protein [Bacillus sp. ISL-7]MBT2736576.1 hypothetical protein [Bacillus sp. ISL-7]
MNFIFAIIYVYIGWKFGKWKEFNRYYPTLLYLIIGDLLSQYLLFNHTMWMFHPYGKIDELLFNNHTLIALTKMVIQYPVTIAIFLGRMTSSKKQQLFSIVLWSGIYSVNTLIAYFFGVITLHNGWNCWWDCAFNVMLFSMLFIHYKKPILAWILTVSIILGLWWIFDVPFSVLK